MRDDARIVLDTNTLISAACFPRSFGRRTFDHVIDHGNFLACEETLAELLEVLTRHKLDQP